MSQEIANDAGDTSPVSIQHPTFMMLDVKGSTKVVQALSRRDYLARVNDPLYAKLTALFTQYGGKMSGTPHGDDAFAVFADVNEAIECAVAIQEELPKLVGEDPEEKVRQLQVRIAVHRAVKETKPHTNGLYPNDADVIYLARLLQYVEGGQIIASEETFDRSDNLRWTWQRWPNRRVAKWTETPQVLYELLYSGWESLEPGIRFLPGWFREKNRYIGRPTLENKALDFYLTRKDGNPPCRLVTLHGYGGMGKTRLAVQCALNVVGLFEGRIHKVSLENAPDRKTATEQDLLLFVAEGFGSALDLPEKRRGPEDILKATVPKAERAPENDLEIVLSEQTLVLLDNFESVNCDAVAHWIGKLLEAWQTLFLLVTGRSALETDDFEQRVSVESMEPIPARELFLQAASRKRDFAARPLKSVDETALQTILTETECIPLALELVAARLGNDSLPELAEGLRRSVLGAETGTARNHRRFDSATRHASLSRSLDWSYGLLSPQAQSVFDLVGLYPDSISRDTMRRMSEREDVKLWLDELVEASLLNRYETSDGQSRYTCLRPTREYAQQSVQARQEYPDLMQRYATVYLELLDTHLEKATAYSLADVAVIQCEWRNAAALADLPPDCVPPETAVSTLHNLNRFLRNYGNYAEAVILQRRANSLAEQVYGKESASTAATLHDLAQLYVRQGKYAEAEPLYKEALAIKVKVVGREHPNTAVTLHDLAQLYARQGKYAEAEPLYKEALAVYIKVVGREHPHTAVTLHDLAQLYARQGKYAEAEPLYKEALAIKVKVVGREHPETATTLHALAQLYADQGKYAEAEGLAEEAYAILGRFLPAEHPHLAITLQTLHTIQRMRRSENS